MNTEMTNGLNSKPITFGSLLDSAKKRIDDEMQAAFESIAAEYDGAFVFSPQDNIGVSIEEDSGVSLLKITAFTKIPQEYLSSVCFTAESIIQLEKDCGDEDSIQRSIDFYAKVLENLKALKS